MSDVDNIEERVIRITIDQLCGDQHPTPNITRNTSFIIDLEADSLDIVELIMAIEDDFDIEIPDTNAEQITTVGEAVDYIREIL